MQYYRSDLHYLTVQTEPTGNRCCPSVSSVISNSFIYAHVQTAILPATEYETVDFSNTVACNSYCRHRYRHCVVKSDVAKKMSTV